MNEIYEGKYAIVSHTRNVKGFIPLESKDVQLKVGQFVLACVAAVGTGKHNVDSIGNLNRKLQLSIEPKDLYRSLSSATACQNMLLQGIILSKEEKGYMVDLGFKDGAQGFLKFDDSNNSIETGEIVQVLI